MDLSLNLSWFANAANNECKWSAAEFVSELICFVRFYCIPDVTTIFPL